VCDSLQHLRSHARQTAWAGTMVCRVMDRESCPREIGAGLVYSLLKSVVMANKLYLNAIIRYTVIMLVNIFL
jgi:hypothetical protein